MPRVLLAYRDSSGKGCELSASLLALGAVILARLGFLRRPVLAVPSLPLPVPAAVPAVTDPQGLSLGLRGDWTPMTGSEP